MWSLVWHMYSFTADSDVSMTWNVYQVQKKISIFQNTAGCDWHLFFLLVTLKSTGSEQRVLQSNTRCCWSNSQKSSRRRRMQSHLLWNIFRWVMDWFRQPAAIHYIVLESYIMVHSTAYSTQTHTITHTHTHTLLCIAAFQELRCRLTNQLKSSCSNECREDHINTTIDFVWRRLHDG